MHLFSTLLRGSGSPLYGGSSMWIGRENKNRPNPSTHVWSKRIQLFDQIAEQHKTMIHVYKATRIFPIPLSSGNAQLPCNFHTIMQANNTMIVSLSTEFPRAAQSLIKIPKHQIPAQSSPSINRADVPMDVILRDWGQPTKRNHVQTRNPAIGNHPHPSPI
jgi:hypothetical protein